ncbi:TetR family transcriptional regulator [Enterobacter bugandensis]|uniref:TetR/AcrR family transcriptional regulator n=1 Tax=Enterobacter TaxID=547 RepID=UPI000F8268EC|nr:MULTISPECIES: TetR family transcriptional regulator [Enterobacter]EGS2004336.1 TetR family transcriptional regulator [Enterobacter cloacae]MBT2090651.1 TetR family transcriptional regulator [Enterobacter bugandensis]RTQ02438.1 TetR family transcriptional regulator [Enterobacter sp. WCHEn045836]
MTKARGKRGFGDPERPERLVDAALAIMLVKGVQGINHRAVAAEAGVPLGSTTYYFRDLDALLIATIEHLIQRRRKEMSAWCADISTLEELIGRLAELIVTRLTRDRMETVLSYELYFLALRRPAFSFYSETSTQVLRDTIRRFADESTTQALTVLVDGFVIEGLLSARLPTIGDLLSAMSAVVRGAREGKSRT